MRYYLPRSPRDVGRRGTILVALGIIWICQGFGTLTEPVTAGQEILLHVRYIPEDLRSTLWIVSGAIAIMNGLKPRRIGSDGLGWFALYIMPVIRALSYLSGWLTADPFEDQFWWWLILPVSMYCIFWFWWFNLRDKFVQRIFKKPYMFGFFGAGMTVLSMALTIFSYGEIDSFAYRRGWINACVWIGYIVIIWVLSGWPENDPKRQSIEMEAASSISDALRRSKRG